ncbi:putative Ctr copper transporter [Septoria linicola]|nr:putative Ctr copper transporter [Septoria linicola]
MDHSGMSTDMSTATTTSSGGMPTSTAMSMGGMDMGGNACKISMLWNWNTIDSCFLARSWRITSNGMFAGSCIGVILLVMILEALRRGAKEYDAYLIRKRVGSAPSNPANESQSSGSDLGKHATATTMAVPPRQINFRPTILEQLVRALLHMLQFAVAYFVMLLAMYYNGYIIICIFIGAFLGAFVFNWATIGLGEDREITFCCG